MSQDVRERREEAVEGLPGSGAAGPGARRKESEGQSGGGAGVPWLEPSEGRESREVVRQIAAPGHGRPCGLELFVPMTGPTRFLAGGAVAYLHLS